METTIFLNGKENGNYYTIIGQNSVGFSVRVSGPCFRDQFFMPAAMELNASDDSEIMLPSTCGAPMEDLVVISHIRRHMDLSGTEAFR